MEGKIERAISQNKMLCAYGKIIIGFSGGADSSALLHYFSGRAQKILCVHINHMIRGDEADRDEAFCRRICEGYGVEFVSYKLDIPALAKASGRGIEETARDERYRVFNSECEARGFDAIMVAHNADDNVESVIFNLVRGSGANGIAGIKAVNGKIIRPLILATKGEILEYCKKNQIEFVTDSTNADTDYTRNYIRHEIVPALQRLNPSLASSVARLGSTLRLDEELIEGLARDFISENCPNGYIYPEKFSECHNSVKARVLKLLACENLDYKSVNACIEFIPKSKCGELINLCKGVSLKRESGYLAFIRTAELNSVVFEKELSQGINYIDGTQIAISYGSDIVPDNNECYFTIGLSRASVKGALVARSRRDGDVIVHGKMTKKVKKLMCERKIPSHLRDKIPIICDDNGIIAIPEVAIRDGAKGNDIILRLYRGILK